MKIIETTFSTDRESRYSKKALTKQENRLTMEEIAKQINASAWKSLVTQSSKERNILEFMKLCKNESREMIFKDPKEHLFVVMEKEFRTGEESGLYFFIGRVKEVKHYTKQDTYLFCEYLNYQGKLKMTCLIVPTNRFDFEREKKAHEEWVITGIVNRRKEEITERYNSYSRRMVPIEPEIKYRNYLKYFSILTTIPQGLFFESEKEKNIIQTLGNTDSVFYRPTKKINNYIYMPFLIIKREKKDLIIENVDKEEISDRKKEFQKIEDSYQQFFI